MFRYAIKRLSENVAFLVLEQQLSMIIFHQKLRNLANVDKQSPRLLRAIILLLTHDGTCLFFCSTCDKHKQA